MFKSLKKKPEKVKEKADFKLSFHATRVPLQGWDKLVISVIPYETGRPVAKTPRAVVKNGSCHWPDNIIESTRLIYDLKTREYEEKKYKFIVSSGSSRSGVLGEVSINLGEFASSNVAQQRALPLKNCNTGTVLHINVTCLTARTSESGRERAVKVSNEADDEETEVVSDDEGQDSQSKTGNVGQGNRGHLQIPRKPALDSPPLSPVSPGARKVQQRNVSQSSLRYSSSSFDSLEVPSTPGSNSFTESVQGYQGDNLSPSSSFASLPEKQDRGRESNNQDSNQASPARSNGHKRTISSSAASGGNHLRNAERGLPNNWNGQTEPFRREGQDDNSSRANLDAAEATIEELRKEVMSSQRQARKLTLDVEELNQSLESKVQMSKDMEMEVSALLAERDGLKQEVEELKSQKHTSEEDRKSGKDDYRFAVEEAQRTIQELKEEIMFEKNTISDLNSQLRKTQESNMDLVAEIDELLKAAKSDAARRSESDHLVSQIESDWAMKFAAKEDEITELQSKIMHMEAKSSQVQTNGFVPAGGSSDVLVNGLQNMVRQLQQDVEELEADTIRLTDENAELQAKLKSSIGDPCENSEVSVELNPDISSERLHLQHLRQIESRAETADEERAQVLGSVASLEGELSRLKEELGQLLDEREESEKIINRLKMENQELEKTKIQSGGGRSDDLDRVKEREVANGHLFQQLADTVAGLEEELQESQEEGRLGRLRIEELEQEILTLTSSGHNIGSSELESLRELHESEKLEKESIQRGAEEKLQMNQEQLNRALAELEFSMEQMDSIELEKRTLLTRSSELEGKLADLEEEKIQRADHVARLELQLKYITEERDLHQQEAGVVEDEKTYLLSEKDRLQAALDSTTVKHQEFVRELTEELKEVIKECDDLKISQHHLQQEVLRLQDELDDAQEDLQQHNVLQEKLQSMSRDHADAVANSTALEVQIARLQSDLEDVEMRSATEFRSLSLLKESEKQRAKSAEEALQQCAMLQKEKVALEKRIAELELVLEDEQNERAIYEEKKEKSSRNGNGHLQTRSLARTNNGHAALEGGALKSLEIEKIKEIFKQKESIYISEIERLELVNEQLAEGAPDSDLKQLQVELSRLQNQNADLNCVTNELQSQLTTQEMLQSEVERLQEVNEKLDIRLQKYKTVAAGADLGERVVRLETELAEATEAINMYKLQLRSAFAEQQNVHAAALQNFGDVDQVVNDLVELRKRVIQLEGELRDMRDRYSTMSLRFAEVEGEREELVMTIRNLRNGRK